MTRIPKSTLALLAVVLLACGARTSRAQIAIEPYQPPAAPVAPAAPAAPAGLPAFLKPGVRVTYYQGQSTIYAPSLLRPTGDAVVWRDAQGREFNLSDKRNSGGAGHATLDVVHVGADLVAVDAGTHLQLADGRFMLAGRNGYTFKPDVGLGGYWTPPAKLQQLAAGPGRIVSRAKQASEGKELDVLVVTTESPTQLDAETWDLETGLLLTASRSSYVPNPSAKVGDPTHVAIIGHQKLVGVRQRTIPWAADPTPDWVKKGAKLKYAGGNTLAMQNGQPITIPGTQVLEMLDVAGGCVAAKITVRADPQPGVQPAETAVNRVYGQAMLTGLWVSPRAVGELKPNAVIDEDPAVGRKVVFVGVQNGAAVFVDQGATDRHFYQYDVRNGMLVGAAMVRDEQFARTIDEYRLVGTE